MPLTRAFHETVQDCVKADSAFRVGLYEEAVQCMRDRELTTAGILAREFINPTDDASAFDNREA
jgi:hypothetical protein